MDMCACRASLVGAHTQGGAVNEESGVPSVPGLLCAPGMSSVPCGPGLLVHPAFRVCLVCLACLVCTRHVECAPGMSKCASCAWYV